MNSKYLFFFFCLWLEKISLVEIIFIKSADCFSIENECDGSINKPFPDLSSVFTYFRRMDYIFPDILKIILMEEKIIDPFDPNSFSGSLNNYLITLEKFKIIEISSGIPNRRSQLIMRAPKLFSLNIIRGSIKFFYIDLN